MGRPLNKKYFGNLTFPYTDFQGTANPDSGFGGEGVLSAAVSGGSYTTRPVFTFIAPQLVGGVTATGTITSKAKSAVATVGGTGYLVGNLLTVTTAGGTAVFAVATLAGDGSTGEVATVTVSNVGSFTTLASGAQATTTNSVAGNGCTLTITYEAAAVVITNAGSGYIAAPTAASGPTQSVTLGVVTLTSTKPYNAIVANAYIPTANGGTQTSTADIIKQVSDRRYKVETSDGVGICQLKTSGAANASGEMTIKATDGSGKTYYVAKLTSRKAIIVPYGAAGHEFPLVNGTAQSVKWSFAAASTANAVVQIENA